jgi:transposase
MDKSQLEGITGLDFSKFSHLNTERVEAQAGELPGFIGLGTNTYCREMKCEGKRRYILCFNPQLFEDQRKMRSQGLENFRSFVNDLNAELREAKRARQRKPTYEKFRRQLVKKKLISFADVKLRRIYVNQTDPDGVEHKIQTYQGEVEIDEKKMLGAGRLDGFWLLVTNHSEKEGDDFRVSVQDAVLPYREKIVIEAAFRDIKSFIEIAPIFVWRKEHVCAHYTICVLSHLIDRTLTLLLHKQSGDKTTDIVSHEKLYKTLSDCKIDRIEIEDVGLSAWNITRATPEQKELLTRLGMKKLLSSDVITKAKNTEQANYV